MRAARVTLATLARFARSLALMGAFCASHLFLFDSYSAALQPLMPSAFAAVSR